MPGPRYRSLASAACDWCVHTLTKQAQAIARETSPQHTHTKICGITSEPCTLLAVSRTSCGDSLEAVGISGDGIGHGSTQDLAVLPMTGIQLYLNLYKCANLAHTGLQPGNALRQKT